MSQLKLILSVHVVLALTPLGIRFVPPAVGALPVIWALASINLSQLMLLAIYVAMFTDDTRRRLLFATLGVLYIGICQVMSQAEIGAGTSVVALGGAYLRFLAMDAGILAALTVILACTRRGVGSVRRLEVIPPKLANTRPQFSLLTLLLVLSLAALVMGLVRSSRVSDVSGSAATMSLHLVLFAVVFGINIVTTVWSTLGDGSVSRRLILVFAVAAILGLSVGVSARHDTVAWWLLASSTLMTLIPTGIIALTLLSLRPVGFRLTRPAADATLTQCVDSENTQ